MRKVSQETRILELFKPYIVKRPNGNCQILFALSELDKLVDDIICAHSREALGRSRR